MVRCSWLVSAVLFSLVAACGGSSPPTKSAKKTEVSSAKQSQGAAETEEQDEDPAAWSTLLGAGDVWSRPALDRFCNDAERAYFVHTTPATSYDTPEGPEAAGCRPRFTGTAVEVGRAEPPCGAEGVPGGTFCCPANLTPPPAPVSGGGRTCEEAVIDYLVELGADPLAKIPKAGDSRAPSFDRFSKVVGKGTVLEGCNVNGDAVVEICTAVRNGGVRGVSVCMKPVDREAADCVAREVRRLEFPQEEQLDLTETTFDPK